MMDYGKKYRQRFLDSERNYQRDDKYLKWLLVIAIVYFGFHIANALANSTVVINQPGGGQMVCINQGGFITCF